MAEFFKNFIAESKRVVWPDRQELVKLTLNVLGLSIIVAFIIYAMDLGVTEVIKGLFKLIGLL